MTIAVTGATGQLGHLVVETLKTKAAPEDLVALARNPDKAADLSVPVRTFDYDAPETLAASLEGVETLLLISGSDIGRRVPQHAAVIEAAKAAGVKHIVYTSLLNAPNSPPRIVRMAALPKSHRVSFRPVPQRTPGRTLSFTAHMIAAGLSSIVSD